MTIVLAPGQGAQKSGMLKPWLTEPNVEATLKGWGERIDLDLLYLGTQAPAEAITDTAIAQPLLVAAGIISFRALSHQVHIPDETILAGHSIGEITVAAISGIIEDETAICLAAERGRLMADSCNETPSAMAAVLGGNSDEVLAQIAQFELTPANFNAQGQIVAAGSEAKIAELIAAPPSGSRVRKLPVAGAFHSPFMSSAQKKFAGIIASTNAADPQYVILSNRDGHPVSAGKEFLDRIVEQITSPVFWTLCLENIRSRKPVGPILELTPAGVLLGIAKRELKEIPGIPINTPEDISAYAAKLQATQ